MTEDRILELIRQHRDHQRRRYQAMERRGQFIIALIAALGAAMVALTGGNMSEVWGSMLLGVLFLVVIFLLLSSLLYAGATIFPLDGHDLFHVGRGNRARSWDRWLTNRAFLRAFRPSPTPHTVANAHANPSRSVAPLRRFRQRRIQRRVCGERPRKTNQPLDKD